MPRYVGLLRGINVGGRNLVPMARLRALFESLGHAEVTTVIQSGNVIFRAAKPVTAASLERAIATEFGVDVTVVLRTPRELASALKANPFPRADPSKLHIGFTVKKPAAAAVKQLDADRFAPDQFAFRARELYLHLPNGMGRSKLPPYLDRKLKIPTTVRNWNTVTKLVELTAS